MKVLAIVEITEDGTIISQQPDRIYMNDATDEVVSKFITNAGKLHEQAQTRSKIENGKLLRLDANFHEITSMGFVHRTELDKYLAYNLSKIKNELSMKYYIKYKITEPFFKYAIKICGSTLQWILKHTLLKK